MGAAECIGWASRHHAPEEGQETSQQLIRNNEVVSSTTMSEQVSKATDTEQSSQKLRTIPRWVGAPLKALFLALATALELVFYMAMHRVIGSFFGSYIAHDFPQVRKVVESFSVGTFAILIIKSLAELLWESFLSLKHLLSKGDSIVKEMK